MKITELDIAPILGVSPTKSAYSVWAEKTGAIDAPNTDGVIALAMDAAVESMFKAYHPHTTFVSTPVADSNVYQTSPHVRFTNDNAVLIIKSESAFAEKYWRDGVPAHYLAEAAYLLSITTCDFARVAVLINNNDYREYTLTRDELDVEDTMSRVNDFVVNNIEANVEPEFTGAADEANALFEVMPKMNDKVRHMTSHQFDEDVACYLSLKAQLDTKKKEVDAMANRLKAYVADNASAESEHYSVKWSRGTRRTFDRARFDADHPGLYEKYQSERPVNGSINVTMR